MYLYTFTAVGQQLPEELFEEGDGAGSVAHHLGAPRPRSLLLPLVLLLSAPLGLLPAVPIQQNMDFVTNL